MTAINGKQHHEDMLDAFRKHLNGSVVHCDNRGNIKLFLHPEVDGEEDPGTIHISSKELTQTLIDTIKKTEEFIKTLNNKKN